jgi:enoyl-CoA hydratase/carnithine racemase
MSNITIEAVGPVARLRLANGVTNAIGAALVEDLLAVLPKVKAEFRGMLLAGGSKFFSIGLNLPELVKLNRGEMDSFWDRFDRLVLDLYTLSVPTVSVIGGHAVAGGTILALATDYRFIAGGRKLMGLNEVNIGLPVPYLADLLLRRVVGDRAAAAMIFSGELIPPDEALRLGLVDGVRDEAELEAHGLDFLKKLALKPQPAMGIIKTNRTRAVCSEFEGQREAKKAAMLDCWFEPAVQGLLRQAAEKF